MNVIFVTPNYKGDIEEFEKMSNYDKLNKSYEEEDILLFPVDDFSALYNNGFITGGKIYFV